MLLKLSMPIFATLMYNAREGFNARLSRAAGAVADSTRLSSLIIVSESINQSINQLTD